MKLLTLLLALGFSFSASAGVRYVNANGASPAPPYTSWATAARVIQDAVDQSAAGDEIVVTNGVYATGGRAVSGALTNRVAVDKPITLRSVNGPEFTIICGHQVPEMITAPGSVRCVYLTNGASLSGFTLTNGATLGAGTPINNQRGGGVLCASTNVVVSNCVLAANRAFTGGGGTYSGTFKDCTLTNNATLSDGGGAHSSVLTRCTLSRNWADEGGGAHSSTLEDCTIEGNEATSDGGGAFASTLNRCVLIDNWASRGGGVKEGTLNHCTLLDNSANFGGGSGFGTTLNNCALSGNSAETYGGGAWGGTLRSCTITGNSAPTGSGAFFSTLTNCILYFNNAPDGANYSYGTFDHCCTTPLPSGGTGNFTNDPQLVSAFHLSATSPCRGAGTSTAVTGTDIDGEAWAVPPSVGCDEFRAGAFTGALTVSFDASYTDVAAGWPVQFTAQIDGRATASVWDFGDGTVVSNRPFATHTWTAAGNFTVRLRAYNDTSPQGVSATETVRVLVAPVHHVVPGNANPVAPFLSWATAAASLEDALNEAFAGGRVLATNGVYFPSEQLEIEEPVLVTSVNGPAATIIDGSRLGSSGCVRLNHAQASVSGFTITGGHSPENGGGVWCGGGVVSNCVITLNRAQETGGGIYFEARGEVRDSLIVSNSAGFGGGVGCDNGGTARSCVVSSNAAGSGGGVYLVGNGQVFDSLVCSNAANEGGGVKTYGGGAIFTSRILGNTASSRGGGVYADMSTLRSCLIAGNQAQTDGGGVCSQSGSFYNCTISANNAPFYASGIELENGRTHTLQNCIVWGNTGTTNLAGPLTPSSLNCVQSWRGGGTILTNDPRFALPKIGDFHLLADSPCVDRGTNYSWMTNSTDVESQPRLIGAAPDFGAYEAGRLLAGFLCEPLRGIAPLPVTVRGYATGTNAASDYFLWDLNGDGSVDRHGLVSDAFVHTFTQPGVYSVLLVVTNARGESVAVSRTNYVIVQPSVRAQFEAAPSSGLWPLTVQFTDRSDGLPDHWFWDFDNNGTADSTERNPTHTYWSPGTYSVSLLVSNNLGAGGSSSSRITKTNLISVADAVHPTHYIAPTGRHVQPFMSWADAATNFAAGVAVASDGDTVLVAEGVYLAAQEARLTRGASVRSVAGADRTIIARQGPAEHRLLWISHSNAVVEGFTFTNGFANAPRDAQPTNCGGAVFIDQHGLLQNCHVVGNAASFSGGGVYVTLGGEVRHCLIESNTAGTSGGVNLSNGGLLEHCVLRGNRAVGSGGGVGLFDGGTARNCLVLENACGEEGGGVYADHGTALLNCTIVKNDGDPAALIPAGSGVAADDRTPIRNCVIWGNTRTPNLFVVERHTNLAFNCVQDWRGGGTSITTNDPRFVDALTGNFRLRPDSPCVDTGTTVAGITNDLDGHWRPLDGHQDGTSRFDLGCYEFDPFAGFRITEISLGPPVRVFFPSATNRLYSLQSCTDLTAHAWAAVPGQTDVSGSGGLDSLSDARGVVSNRFYRVQTKPR
ncbi:MAG: PKD domain-containing protein [Verrucomicrobia bacterium]|nr:PKD domain-containing protein [Verrucomicrobiota bacterium]